MRLKRFFFVICIHLYTDIQMTCCQCVLPLSDGTWITSSRGTWLVPQNRTQLQNFRASLSTSQQYSDLDCISKNGGYYLLGTSVQLFNNILITSYTCVDIRTTTQSPNKYEMYFITGIDLASGEPFTSNVDTACTGGVNETATNTVVVIAEGSHADDIKTTLPNVILGVYDIKFTDENGLSSNNSQLDSCNDKTALRITKVRNITSSTSNIAYSGSGVLYCVKSWQMDAVTYIYAYNNDTTVASSSTYRFSCWAVRASTGSSNVLVAVAQDVCKDDQTPTNAPDGVQTMILRPSVTCAPSEDTTSGISTWIIVVIVISCVLVVTYIVLVVICCVRKHEGEKDEKMAKDETKSDLKKTLRTDTELGRKRSKSSNDMTAEMLKNEKMKKKMTKKKATRSIAVQASIWTAPVQRTITALETDVKRTDSKGSIKFLPYMNRPIQRVQHSKTISETSPAIKRSKTTLEKEHVQTLQPIVRSKTQMMRNGAVKSHVGKSTKRKSSNLTDQRKILTNKLAELQSKPADMFAYEFEKHFPFPMEGNPKEFHNTLETDIPDETTESVTPIIKKKENFFETDSSSKHKSNVDGKNEPLSESNMNNNKTDKMRHSAKSRPSTSEGVLGVRLQHSGSVRKTNSERLNRSKTILKFSYNSPYAMSDTQKDYVSKKTTWVRGQIVKNEENKRHVEEMKKLENQRAFDQWIKNKQKSIQTFRSKYKSNQRNHLSPSNNKQNGSTSKANTVTSEGEL